MALVLRSVYKALWQITEIERDRRLENLPLMASPWPVVGIMISYYVFVKRIGPMMMENRKAFDLKPVILIYNVTQVVLNTVLASMIFMNTYGRNYSWRCQPSDYSQTDDGYRNAYNHYFYFIVKVFDLLDTVFFVLRKKQQNVTFLHVYHHIFVAVGSYLSGLYFPGGHASLLAIINSLIHGIMYFYYFLTSFRSELKNSIWWKKHITQVQMVQFAILVVHFAQPLFRVDCSYPRVWSAFVSGQNLFMLALFSDFYIKTYVKKKNQ